ncbi:GNAT family N-acetyltransferase [Psychromarinibacter sp. C21-152]|uniref:GNAT family N-acetyltransferase n=1 Tax=Psychromarinibacter sediminicola TaxID=3033385 RepID=A0AAE3T717_9RHOB|nr:GNAT family N-acetyltransferase [Psychromarinibacter sediminicola]MDF0599857.1 GNAT family N-acetyltransferase [Psychromarinibacter sediminicola]
MRLRPARRRDVPRLAGILGGWVQETVWMPKLHDAEEDRAHVAMLIDRFEVTAARDWRGAQGFLARDGGWVHSLYVAPRARGQGVGARLLEAAKARTGRLELWCFQANLDARRFYARHGFAEVEFTDGAENDEKLPDVRLVWERPEGGR